MLQPLEMKQTRPMKLHGGVVSTTADVWNMLVGSRNDDLNRVKELASHCPALLTCQYDYTAPLHLAVREGHLDLARHFVEQGALDPTYRNHPFLEPLVTLAEDRGYGEIAELLERSLDNPELTHEWGDTGAIERSKDETQSRFQEFVDKNKHAEVEAMLKAQPELALDEDAFWGEGILAMPAKDGDRQMLELLMRYGARVPDLSKWGARYYFRHYDIAVFLMGRGMNPNHMNWRQFTLLHDMAFTGDVRKASLLLDHGADINAIDDEYQSTPLGYAAHFGRREVVALLLERGADPNKSGAPWATPLAWALKKGHAEIESDLCQAGAHTGRIAPPSA
jgi:ankyrin repeat protein